MQQQEEEKKGSLVNIKGESQESDEKALNILLIGPSGSGKSSLINYLAGDARAYVGHSGTTCTKDNMFY
jgi:predicted GTPase